jgi:Ssp1 endopeptidase immunity protein Rap1a
MIRVLTVTCLALVAGLPLSAHAMGSARELADDCRSLLQAKPGTGEQIRIPFTKKALVCWGYMQAMQDLSVLADEDGRRIMGACPPQRTTLLELIQAFVSYARSHELSDNAALAVTRALQEAFPCKARQGFRGLWAPLLQWGSIHAQFNSPLARDLAKSMQSVRGGWCHSLHLERETDHRCPYGGL